LLDNSSGKLRPKNERNEMHKIENESPVLEKSENLKSTNFIEPTVILPPGKYWIGDPGYVMDSRWDAFCAIAGANHWADGVYELDNFKMWYHATKNGDGCYPSWMNSKKKKKMPDSDYMVDTGAIAVIPIELVDEKDNCFFDEGRPVIFRKAITCSYQDGLFCIKSAGLELVIDSTVDEFFEED